MRERGSPAMLTVLASSSHIGDRAQNRSTMAAIRTAAAARPTHVIGRDSSRPGARSVGTAGSGRSGGASTERLVTDRQGSHRGGPCDDTLRWAVVPPVRSVRVRWLVAVGAGLELEGDGVDAVALARRAGTVVEDMTQVPTTAPARHLGPDHPVAEIPVELHVGRHGRLGE